MPAVAQTDIGGTALSENQYYYVRNVSTGLYLRYGGGWGAFASEGRAGHPVMIKKDGDFYSINSLRGALNSGNAGADLFFDRPQEESKWQFVKSEGTNSYMLVANSAGALASLGRKSGDLALVSYNEYDNRVRWEFLTEAQVRNLVNSASATKPIDVTPLIKASSFDLYDGEEMVDLLKAKFGVTDSQEDGSKTTNHYTYVGYWKNYMVRRFYNWHTMVRGTGAEIYNGIGIAQDNTNAWTLDDENCIYQEVTLPKGNYYFSFEGFYRLQQQKIVQAQTKSGNSWKNSSDPVRNAVTDVTMNARVRIQYKKKNNYSWTDIKSFALAQDKNVNVPDVFYDDYKCIQDVTGKDTIFCSDEECGPAAAALLRDGDLYMQSCTFSLDQECTIRILIEKVDETKATETTESTGNNKRNKITTVYKNWVCFDNFTLVSYGQGTATTDLSKLYYEKLSAYIDEVRAKMDELGFNDEAKELFEGDMEQIVMDATNKKATIVLTDDLGNSLSSRVVNTEALYLEAMAIIEEAFNAAYNLHLECLKKGEMDLSDYMVFNRGFELGNTVGWSGGSAVSASGYANAEKSYVCKATGAVTQTVVGLPNGMYKVSAKLTSTTAGNTVFLLGNNSRKGEKINTAKSFQDVEMYFLVENHKATIGAIGATMADGEAYYYNNKDASSGCEYAMDYFSLSYVCNVGNGRLYFALEEAKQAKANLDSDGQALVDLDDYQTIYDERKLTVDNDGVEETEAILEMLKDAAKAQRSIGADMTYAIWNHNFERDVEGWTLGNHTYGWDVDAGARVNSGIYATKAKDSEGAKLLNVWAQGAPTTQTIENLPNGVYRVEVLVSSGDAADKLGKVMVMGNDGARELVTPPDAGMTFANVGVEFNVTDNTATIGVVGAGGNGEYNPDGAWWYKADNFRLTLVRPLGELILDENSEKPMPKFEDEYETVTIKRSVSSATDDEGDLLWSAFAVPFDISAAKIAELGWEVKELTGSRVKEDGKSVVLNFGDAESIVANKPYLIRTANGIDKQFVMTNVVVNTTALDGNGHVVQSEPGQDDSNVDDIEFVGSYTNEFIPQYAYFISGNKFYRAAKANNTKMKGYRAYFMFVNNSSEKRSIGYRWDDGNTGLESAADEDAVVVAIYNLNGVRLNGMQEGVNILQMSDGSTVKVIIK